VQPPTQRRDEQLNLHLALYRALRLDDPQVCKGGGSK
jgi:hypothetical protein